MRSYKNILATGALVTAVLLSGCNNEPKKAKTLEGTVKEEFGTAQRIIGSSGASFGNESIKLGGPIYGLVLETDKGEYVISVSNNYKKPIYALAKAIEQGDKIRITYDKYSTYLGEDRIGKTGSDTITLIEKSKK